MWLAETSGPDPLVAAALIAREHDLEVGTAVVPVWSRTPAVLAAAAADIVAIGRGRPFHLGLGAGGQAIVERWHGLDFAGSVERVADTIAILRQALAGERTGAPRRPGPLGRLPVELAAVRRRRADSTSAAWGRGCSTSPAGWPMG